MRRLITFFTVIALTNASVFYRLNELGSYDGSIARQEIRTADGVVRGTYTYIDGDGETKTIQYGGGSEDSAVLKVPALGEKQQIESSLPAQEMDEEVVESLAEGQNETREKNVEESMPTPALPEPVTYTPEVAAARAAHFAARDQAIYLQQGVTTSQQPLLSPQILEYSPFIREYYGAAKHYRTVNPYYGYLL